MGKVYHIYCDESRQCSDRFMIIGGIIIDAEDLDKFDETMAALRHKTRLPNELKWNKINEKKYIEYREFVDYFFALNNTDTAHYKCIIVDNHKVNHKKYSQGDKDLSFYKFYYQLLLHKFCCKYCDKKGGVKFIIHPDHRQSKHSLAIFQEILNKGINKKIGVMPVVSVEPIKSHHSEVLQVADILIGAVGFEKNDFHKIAGASKGKIDLCAHIAQRAGVPDLVSDTKYSNDRFEIWNIKL